MRGTIKGGGGTSDQHPPIAPYIRETKKSLSRLFVLFQHSLRERRAPLETANAAKPVLIAEKRKNEKSANLEVVSKADIVISSVAHIISESVTCGDKKLASELLLNHFLPEWKQILDSKGVSRIG